MKPRFSFQGSNLGGLLLFPASLFLFWVILFIDVPYFVSQYFHAYSLGLLIVVFISYFVSFSLPGRGGSLAPLALTMIFLSLSLSYMWTSGFSDNFIIAGLLPYKDAKNYYFGSNLLLHGLPMIAGQSTERPLFPGFLASLLFFAGGNLKITLAIIVQLVGIGIYYSARQIRNSIGILAAAAFATLLYFYIQPFAGYALSELLGFLAGCWAFTLLMFSAKRPRVGDLTLGIAILLLGISARAGAFFILPLLAIWMGWVFRDKARFSLKAVVYALVLIAILYVLMNSVFARLLDIPSGYAFGNFSYAIYGQVKGGTGWHSAIEDLSTRDPRVVYHAAWEFFLKHPLSLFIGFAKSYRDFFLFGDGTVFPFAGQGWQYFPNVIIWLGMLVALLRGIIHLIRNVRSNRESLLLASFIGVFLSIPFLPPIDGGARFHAGTMPFFFAPLVAGIQVLVKGSAKETIQNVDSESDRVVASAAITGLLVFVLVIPVLLHKSGHAPSSKVASCQQYEQPFVIEVHPESYIDLIQTDVSECGRTPQVCLNDFESKNIELVTDNFYKTLIAMAKEDGGNFRLVPALDLIENKFHYYYFSLETFPAVDSGRLISGCSMETKTGDESVFEVKSAFLHEEIAADPTIK